MYTLRYMPEVNEQLARLAENRKKRERQMPAMNDSYKRIFDTIARSSRRQQEGWIYCFTGGELMLLLDYILSGNSHHTSEEIEALIGIFRHTGDFGIIRDIYIAWQNRYEEKGYANLFKMIDEQESLREEFMSEYSLQPARLYESIRDETLIEMLNRAAALLANGSYQMYTEALVGFGLKEDTRLYENCVKKYALVCDGKSYMNMGVEKVIEFLHEINESERITLVQNMLNTLDSFQIKKFVTIVPEIRQWIGESGTDSYNRIIAPLSEEVISKYTLWLRQYSVYEVLGEGERSAFWMGFITKASIRRHPRANVLFITFGTFTAIEFPQGEAVYFFDNKYMNETVYPGIEELDNDKEVDEWIHQNTEWGANKTNRNHWRRAHFGNWESDIKSYIRSNTR